MESEGKVAKQIGPLGFYARVWVNCQEVGQQPSSVTLDARADDGWYRSEGWVDAALAGAAIGLRIASKPAVCTVTRIHGMPCDTNSPLVAIAAMRAVWAALGFEPDARLTQQVEMAILRRSEMTVADLVAELGYDISGT